MKTKFCDDWVRDHESIGVFSFSTWALFLGVVDGELFPNMNTRVPSELIFLLTHEFEKLAIL